MCLVTSLTDSKSLISTIYPNPTQGIVSWESEQNWVLFNALGKELIQGKGKSFDLYNYPEGLYLLKVGNRVTRMIRRD